MRVGYYSASAGLDARGVAPDAPTGKVAIEPERPIRRGPGVAVVLEPRKPQRAAKPDGGRVTRRGG